MQIDRGEATAAQPSLLGTSSRRPLSLTHIYIYMYIYIYREIYVSIHYLSVYLSISLSLYPFLSFSLHIHIYIYMYRIFLFGKPTCRHCSVGLCLCGRYPILFGVLFHTSGSTFLDQCAFPAAFAAGGVRARE